MQLKKINIRGLNVEIHDSFGNITMIIEYEKYHEQVLLMKCTEVLLQNQINNLIIKCIPNCRESYYHNLSEPFTLPLLPSFIKSIDFLSCYGLKNVDCISQCDVLRTLTICACNELDKNLIIPSKYTTCLTKLHIEHCKNLESIVIPDSVEHLIIVGCPNLKSINYPSNLVELRLVNVDVTLPETFEDYPLTSLTLGCMNAKNNKIPNVPINSLCYMKLHQSYYRELPANLGECQCLSVLLIEQLCVLETLPKLPTSLTKLVLQQLDINCICNIGLKYCNALDSLSLIQLLKINYVPELPCNLTSLELKIIPQIEALTLPEKCNTLYIRTCLKLRSIVNFPTTLRDVSISQTCISHLPLLNDGLSYLQSYSSFTRLPYFPKSLKIYYVDTELFMKSKMKNMLCELGLCTQQKIAPNTPFIIDNMKIGITVCLSKCQCNIIHTLQYLQHYLYSQKLRVKMMKWYWKSQQSKIESKYHPSKLSEYLQTHDNCDLISALDNWQ